MLRPSSFELWARLWLTTWQLFRKWRRAESNYQPSNTSNTLLLPLWETIFTLLYAKGRKPRIDNHLSFHHVPQVHILFRRIHSIDGFVRKICGVHGEEILMGTSLSTDIPQSYGVEEQVKTGHRRTKYLEVNQNTCKPGHRPIISHESAMFMRQLHQALRHSQPSFTSYLRVIVHQFLLSELLFSIFLG